MKNYNSLREFLSLSLSCAASLLFLEVIWARIQSGSYSKKSLGWKISFKSTM